MLGPRYINYRRALLISAFTRSARCADFCAVVADGGRDGERSGVKLNAAFKRTTWHFVRSGISARASEAGSPIQNHSHPI